MSVSLRAGVAEHPGAAGSQAARSIVNRPAMPLAGEPTRNLDAGNSNAARALLRDLNERLGQTILMITHHPEAAAYGHRTVCVRDGKFVG